MVSIMSSFLPRVKLVMLKGLFKSNIKNEWPQYQSKFEDYPSLYSVSILFLNSMLKNVYIKCKEVQWKAVLCSFSRNIVEVS